MEAFGIRDYRDSFGVISGLYGTYIYIYTHIYIYWDYVGIIGLI